VGDLFDCGVPVLDFLSNCDEIILFKVDYDGAIFSIPVITERLFFSDNLILHIQQKVNVPVGVLIVAYIPVIRVCLC